MMCTKRQKFLEHVTSQTLVNRLADYLNHPEFCPHGGVIPEDNQPIHEEKRQTLTDYPVGTKKFGLHVS